MMRQGALDKPYLKTLDEYQLGDEHFVKSEMKKLSELAPWHCSPAATKNAASAAAGSVEQQQPQAQPMPQP
jgi:hypothetical protein